MISVRRIVWLGASLGAISGAMSKAAGAADDGVTITKHASAWTIGNDRVERTIVFADGTLRMQSFRDVVSGRQLISPAAAADELGFRQDDQTITGGSGGWSLVGAKDETLEHGERELDITLQRQDQRGDQRGNLQATKSYVAYPHSSVIREWVTFANGGKSPLKVDEPDFLRMTAAVGKLGASLDFHWMTGGENNPGSWMLRTEKLTPGKAREFDSYSPFPAAAGPTFLGDGIDARIQLNDKRIWPANGDWQYVHDATVHAPVDVTTTVVAGDRIVFRVNMHGNIGWDTTAFDPTITYDDTETHVASAEFSGKQGENNWRYQYVEAGKFVDLVFYPEHGQWRKAKDNATGTPFIGKGDQHPDAGQDSVRVWTASKAGTIHITGSVCNTGNASGGASGAGFKPGSSSFAPWYALYDRQSHEGLFVGWDYFGHWASSVRANDDGAVGIELKVAGHHQTLGPGESFSTPQAFVGLFRDDLDQAGNALLDWQYAYGWDYTRDGTGGTYPWFPALRTLGFWMKGTGWGQSGVGWLGGNPDTLSTFRKVFRTADYMRYTGVDVYHRDWGWWDVAGDWNGPDFGATNRYLHKSGMGELIYAFLYTVSHDSKVGKAHPEWLIGDTLDMSKPAVVEFIEGQLDSFVKRWGDFEWRNDSFFTAPRNGDDTPLLGQDQRFRQILRHFLEKHRGSAFQAVNGGGNYGGYEYVSFASTFSFSDGAVGPIRNYWAALLFPPDKTSDIPDIYNPDQYDKATWRGLLCINYDTTGDTWNVEKLEGIRQLNDIYHYLLSQGVVGRWVHVYRPVVEGDDATMYFERLSRDGKRGIIIPKHVATRPVTIFPKGLLAKEKYVVSFQESEESQTGTGAELMTKGIAIAKMLPGELIYLNLPLHPGSKLDQIAPMPPAEVHAARAENMGFPGVELTWKPGADDNWVSYYEIFRDGVSIDKVAKGTYDFDHSAGADLGARYEVRTVDGAGNCSAMASAPVAAARASVVDDGQMNFSGSWQHQRGLQPAFAGTISSSDEKGATAEAHVRGKRVLIYFKLGADCGIADISIDGGPPEKIDTYDADDLWGAAVFVKTLDQDRQHTIRVTVTGEKSGRASRAVISLDGIRGELTE